MEDRFLLNLMVLTWIIHAVLIVYLIYSATEVKGSKRWILLYGTSYQPSELLKVSFFICFSRLLNKKYFFMSLFLLLVTISLLAKQPDLGNIIIILISSIILLIFHGNSKLLLITILFGGCTTSFYGVKKFPHARERISAFYKRDKSSKHSYQNLRSMLAIQNGRYFGVGPGNGTVKNTIPDAYSDFIFSVIGEEFGLIGCTIICLSYFLFFVRCLLAASIGSYSLILVSIASLITVQSWIHMGTNVWIIPTKGTTLPCISHGGASFIVSQIALGIINNSMSMIRRKRVIS